MKSALKYYFTLFSVWIGCFAQGQRVKIGDRMPDIRIQNVINYPASSLKLSDLKKKLIVLDFWNPGCKGCIEAFPKMESLQKKYSDKIQIILVNDETADSTQRFFSRMKKIKMPNLPLATNDSILSDIFPHKSVPHHVWIDSDLTVVAITQGQNTNAWSLAEYLTAKKIDLPEKKDKLTIDWSQPLISQIDSFSNIYAYSYLIKAIREASSRHSVESKNGSDKPNRIYFNRASALDLYIAAFNERGKYNFVAGRTVILELNNPEIFVRPKDEIKRYEWDEKYSYCYDLVVPPHKATELYTTMKQDLSKYFEATGRIEKRKIRCLLLVRTDSIDKLQSKGGEPKTNFWIQTDDSLRYINNLPFSSLATKISVLNKTNYPFVDITGYTGKIDIKINADILGSFDLQNLRKELQKYNLDLIEGDHAVDVLVITQLTSSE